MKDKGKKNREPVDCFQCGQTASSGPPTQKLMLILVYARTVKGVHLHKESLLIRKSSSIYEPQSKICFSTKLGKATALSFEKLIELPVTSNMPQTGPRSQEYWLAGGKSRMRV